MSDNPLSGLSIPSLRDIADQVVDSMGNATIDLANPLQRQRLKSYIQQYLGMALDSELERALRAATERALEHVFRVMRDADYQEKKRVRRAAYATRRLEIHAKKQDAEREARMDYSRRKVQIEKETLQ